MSIVRNEFFADGVIYGSNTNGQKEGKIMMGWQPVDDEDYNKINQGIEDVLNVLSGKGISYTIAHYILDKAQDKLENQSMNETV